jgi:hypothetical protein
LIEHQWELLLKGKEVESLVDLARYRRRNITLRCHGGGPSVRGGFTDGLTLAPPVVG